MVFDFKHVKFNGVIINKRKVALAKKLEEDIYKNAVENEDLALLAAISTTTWNVLIFICGDEGIRNYFKKSTYRTSKPSKIYDR